VQNDKRICKATTRAGNPCGAAPTAGGLCFFHANPNKASELGRIGGKKRHHISTERPVPLSPLLTVKELLDLVPHLVRDLKSGKLDARVANALVQLLNFQLRAMGEAGLEEIAKLQQRVNLLEKQLSRIQDTTGSMVSSQTRAAHPQFKY
jgi:hypothetical protein